MGRVRSGSVFLPARMVIVIHSYLLPRGAATSPERLQEGRDTALFTWCLDVQRNKTFFFFISSWISLQACLCLAGE